MLPAFTHYRPPLLPFRWRVALAREFYAIFLVTTVFFALDTLDTLVATGRPHPHAVWTVTFLAGALFFVIMRVLKKRGRLVRRPDVPVL